MRILLGLGLLPLALLAGCKNDAQILAEARSKGLEQCNNSAAVKQAPPGFDASRFCTCLVEKTMEGKTVSDLENMKEAEQASLGQRAGMECAAQQAGAAPAPAATPGAVPGDQGATNQVAADTVEETVDEAE